MRAERSVGLEDARRFLVGRFRDGFRDLAELKHGMWSSAFRVRLDDGDQVVRFSSIREDFDKDARAAVHATNELPIPPITEIAEAYGGYYAISPFVEGQHLDALDEAGVRRTLPSLFAALDAARRADVSGTTGFGRWRGDGTAEHPSWREALLDVARDPNDRWRKPLASAKLGSAPFDGSFERMRELLGRCPEARHLVHGDLPHGNVLVLRGRVTALIDWGSAMYGDHLYDVAWLSFWAPWHGWATIDFGAEAREHYRRSGLVVDRVAERLRCYELHIGLDAQTWFASRGDWAALEKAIRQTTDLARGA
jgi:hygromycin-B 4-O-kinase